MFLLEIALCIIKLDLVYKMSILFLNYFVFIFKIKINIIDKNCLVNTKQDFLIILRSKFAINFILIVYFFHFDGFL